MAPNNRPKCPVSDEGCPPVITMAADMKWVKRGAYAAIAEALALLMGVLIFLAVTTFNKAFNTDASANSRSEITRPK
jgi:hypothetical protein